MIDIHSITPSLDNEYFKSCKASLNHSLIKHYTVLEKGLPIGPNRKEGYSLGGNPILSHSDYDDTFNNTVYRDVIAAFEDKEVSLVFTLEYRVPFKNRIATADYNKEAHLRSPSHVHGVIAYRREFIEALPDSIWSLKLVDWAISLMAAKEGKVVQIRKVGRNWRYRPGQHSSTVNPRDIAIARDWYFQNN